MASTTPHSDATHNNCGLHHLVEAATALTQLVSSVPQPKTAVKNVNRSHTISDDEDTRARIAMASQQHMTSMPAIPIAPNCSLPLPLLNINKAKEKKTGSSSCIREIFPQRLMRILSDPSISDIITWLPHGRSFVIIQQEVLAAKILPKCFPESASAGSKSSNAACKYPSFTRKLNRWGFRQVTRGPDAGAFHHKFFCRDQPRLCLQMICQRSRRRKGEAKGGLVLPSPRVMDHPVTDTESVTSRVSNVSSLNSFTSAPIGFPIKLSHRATSPPVTANTMLKPAIVSNTTSPMLTTLNTHPLHRVSHTNLVHLNIATRSINEIMQPIANNHAFLQQNLALNAISAAASLNISAAASLNTPAPAIPPYTLLTMHSHRAQPHTAPAPAIKPAIADPNLIIQTLVQPASTTVEPLSTVAVPAVAPPSVAPKGAIAGQISSSSEEERIASAKSMLYRAYLRALG